jgi:hypothetical protein
MSDAVDARRDARGKACFIPKRLHLINISSNNNNTNNDTLTVKGTGNAKSLASTLLVHAPFLGQVRLAVEDVIRPAVGTLHRQLEFLFQVRQGLRIIFLESLHLLLQGLAFLSVFAQAEQLGGALAVISFTTALGVGQFSRSFLDRCPHAVQRLHVVLMLDLHDTVFFRWKGPKVVGSSNLFLVDEGIINQRLVNVSNAVVVSAVLERQVMGDTALLFESIGTRKKTNDKYVSVILSYHSHLATYR